MNHFLALIVRKTIRYFKMYVCVYIYISVRTQEHIYNSHEYWWMPRGGALFHLYVG